MVAIFFLGNFGGDKLGFVVKLWCKVVLWVFWRERESGRKERLMKGKREKLFLFYLMVLFILF